MKYLLIVLFLLNYNLYSFTENEYKNLFSTTERVVVDLKGYWTNSETNKKQYIPFSTSQEDNLSFEKEIKIDKKLINNKIWQLYFAGLDSDVEIYINENFVGKYLGGLTPFYVKIQKNYITSETVKIKFKLFPLENYTRISKTMGLDIMKSYYAITRNVLLIGTPKIWVSNISNFNSKISKSNANISADITINSGSLITKNQSDTNSLYKDNMNVKVVSELLKDNSVVATSKELNIRFESDRSIQRKINFKINNPKLWSIENPNLYKIKVKVYYDDKLLDEFSNNVGIKEIKFNNGKVYLNNQKIFIKGVDYIEDKLNKGATLTVDDFEKDIILIKKLGANLVRFKYHAPSKAILDLFDKYGILTLIELPAHRLPSRIYNTNEIKIRLENISTRYEENYSTNASVMALGLGSEIEFNEKPRFKYKFKKNNNFYRSYSFNNLDNLGDEDLSIISIYKSLLNYEKIIETIDNKLKNQKSVLLNFGIPVQFKNNNGYLDKLSVQNQANIIRNLFHIVENKDLAGCIINSFNDYYLENPTLRTNNSNIYISSTGLVDRKRNTRLSYETTQSLFNNEKEPILDAGSYSEESTISFIIIGLFLLLIFIFLLNRIKRFREYFKRSLISPYNFYADIRDQRLISTTITLILSIMISVTLGIFLSNFLFHFKNYEAEQYILKLLLPSSNLQSMVFKMIWKPEPFMLILSTIIFLFLFIISGVLKLFSSVSNGKIFFSDTIVIAVWSFIPVLLILPFAIVSQKLFVLNEGIAITLIVFLLILLIWSFFRMVKAITVVFDLSNWKVNSIVGIIIIVLIILPLTLYQLQNSFIDYIIYFTKFYF